MTAEFHDWLISRRDQLMAEGTPGYEAWNIAVIESQIDKWPSEWGNKLICTIYGPIEIQEPLDFPELGVRIDNVLDPVSTHLVTWNSYNATVQVDSKSLEGVVDGLERLEKVLGACHVENWDATIQYFCPLVHSGGRDLTAALDAETGVQISAFLSRVNQLPEHQQQLIFRAIWWIRYYDAAWQTDDPSMSIFPAYLGNWNALEILSQLIGEAFPENKMTRSERDKGIAEYLDKIEGPPKVNELQECYRLFVDTGTRGRVSHAFNVCFGSISDQYVAEFFECNPPERRLYQIRNDISHGNISEYDPNQRLRVGAGLNRLRVVVLNMIRILTGGVILDHQVRSCYTCVHLKDRSCELGNLPPDQIFWKYLCSSYLRSQISS